MTERTCKRHHRKVEGVCPACLRFSIEYAGYNRTYLKQAFDSGYDDGFYGRTSQDPGIHNTLWNTAYADGMTYGKNAVTGTGDKVRELPQAETSLKPLTKRLLHRPGITTRMCHKTVGTIRSIINSFMANFLDPISNSFGSYYNYCQRHSGYCYYQQSCPICERSMRLYPKGQETLREAFNLGFAHGYKGDTHSAEFSGELQRNAYLQGLTLGRSEKHRM